MLLVALSGPDFVSWDEQGTSEPLVQEKDGEGSFATFGVVNASFWDIAQIPRSWRVCGTFGYMGIWRGCWRTTVVFLGGSKSLQRFWRGLVCLP